MRLGNHELLIRLASGGAANVFLVRDVEHDNRLLALKILLPSLAQNEDFLNMFFTEAKIASHLRHPNIVTIAGFGQVEGIHCLAMEYVFGASLSQVLRASARAKKPLTVGVLLRLTASVCDALHYAHELADENGESMGLVHRDVTPQNILIGFNGVPKLTDFGIAKATNRGWETQAGIVKGKFSYMSPEQALGKTVDRRSDIFGAGIVLWEALTGRDLFRGSTPMEVLTAIREHKIDPPSKVVPGLTPIVDPIVMRALRRSPKQRYATAADMRDEIEELIDRAGVKIDSEAISKEFADIYGDDIGRRALALRQAILGMGELDMLASALGGTVLNPKQLPAMQGGVNDPDPLGLFSPGGGDRVSEEVSAAMPARSVRAFTNTHGKGEDDFEIIDDDDDLLDMDNGDVFPSTDMPHVPANRLVNGWDDSTSTRVPEDELLSMISEEDATIGFLPPKFAERFGQALQDALNNEGFEDEQTVGVPDETLARLRAISNDESVSGVKPDLFREGPQSSVVYRATRPVPRAPSVLMEEARARDRFEPRAPSWDMDPNTGAEVQAGEFARPSRPPLGAPPPPPPTPPPQAGLMPEIPGAELPLPSPDKPPLPDFSMPSRNGRRPLSGPFDAVNEHTDADVQGNDQPFSNTDRAPAPAFGTYSYTRGSNRPWNSPEPLDEPVPPPPDESTDAGPVNTPSPISVPMPEPGDVLEPSANDWEEPSPLPPPAGPLSGASAIVADDEPISSPKNERASPTPIIPAPSPTGVQLSMSMLVLLAVLLLIAGAALGALFGPQL